MRKSNIGIFEVRDTLAMITIALPAYNEEGSIEPLLDKIDALASGAGLDLRVLVVDDGSADRTAEAARAHALAARGALEVIAHPQNMGLGAGVRTGINAFLERAAPGDTLVIMDADNTQEPSDIPALLAELARGAGVAIASRFTAGGGEVGVGPLRRLFSRGVRVFMRIVAPVPGVRDYSCGFRAYSQPALARAAAAFGPKLVEAHNFSIMCELLIKLNAVGVTFAEIPFTVHYDRKQGPSKIRLAATLMGYAGLFAVRLRASRAARAFLKNQKKD